MFVIVTSIHGFESKNSFNACKLWVKEMYEAFGKNQKEMMEAMCKPIGGKIVGNHILFFQLYGGFTSTR